MAPRDGLDRTSQSAPAIDLEMGEIRLPHLIPVVAGSGYGSNAFHQALIEWAPNQKDA